MTWTIDVEATRGGTLVDLEGYRIVDDLQHAGNYVAGSFEVDGVPAVPGITGSTLEYMFPEGSTSPLKITYKTEIPESRYYTDTEQTLSNPVQLLDDDDVVGTAQAEVKFTPKWIEKSGEAVENTGVGYYDPTNRTITWTIIANHMGASLSGVKITDELKGGLTFASAEWSRWTGAAWDAPTPIVPDANHEYMLGTINSMIKLTIVANVPNEAYTTGLTNYTNTATISWGGYEFGSGSVEVPIGFNAITKSGTADSANRLIHWTVTVDVKGQTIPDLRVYDLLVHGGGSLPGSATGFPAGLDRNDLTPRYNQRYGGNFSVSSGSATVNVIPIMQGGNHVADLLEISNLATNQPNTFHFDSLIADPTYYAGNVTRTFRNTATLFSAYNKLNEAQASVNYPANVLRKQLLTRAAIADPVAGVNSERTENPSLGFDYQDKSAIFRLSVNAQGIDLTGALGEPVTVTDTLPAGWEFAEIVPGSDYLIFEGTHEGNGNVQASVSALNSVAGLNAAVGGDTATFTFNVLDRPYVILLKARPTTGEAESYFSKNQTITKTNNVQLHSASWPTGVSASQNVSITSEILSKNFDKVENGVLRWTVNYRPYLTEQPVDRLEDRLPLGLDLPMDANGNLEIAGNIEPSR